MNRFKVITMDLNEEEVALIKAKRLEEEKNSFKPRQLDSFTVAEKCSVFDHIHNEAWDMLQQVKRNGSLTEGADHYIWEDVMEILTPKDKFIGDFWNYYNTLIVGRKT